MAVRDTYAAVLVRCCDTCVNTRNEQGEAGTDTDLQPYQQHGAVTQD